jgi:hypothetical protein
MGFSAGGSGSSSINAASDVIINNLSNNETLQYVSTDSKWRNKASSNLTATGLKSTSYTAVVGEYIPVNANASTVTITLPAAPNNGSRVGVKLIQTTGSNTCIINRSGSDVFNQASGAVTYTLTAAGTGATFQYDATTSIWYVTDATPLSSLSGNYAPLAGPVPASYAAANDARFVSAQSSQKVADFTLSLAQAGAVIEADSTSTITVTVPPSSTVPFLDNTLIEISQTNTGQVVVAPGLGVTLQNPAGLKTRAQWSSVNLRKRPGSGTSSTLPTTGLLMRYRADDLTGANASPVSSWPESSGNNLPPATQATTANQPVLAINGLNGHKGVTFNGTSSFLSLTGSALNVGANSAGTTLFVVYTCPTVSSGSRSLITLSSGVTTANTRMQLQHRNSSGVNMAGGRRLDSDGGAYASSATGVVGGENVVLTGTFNFSGGVETLYRNGTSTATANFASSGLSSNTPSLAGSIGSNPVGSSENFYGTIMEIMAYNTVDAGTLASVDTYVQNTYGISTADSTGVADQWVVTGDTAV